MGIQLEGLVSLTQGAFWTALNTALGFVVLWTVVFIGKLTGCLGKISRGLDYWTELVLPFVGNGAFMPLLSMLFSVFLCSKATSSDLTDSFLNADCYQRCWKDWHFPYILITSLVLAVFTPFAVFTRPLWQGLQRTGSVKQSPPGLMLKSIVQLVLVAAQTSLKEDYAQAYAVVFFTIMGLFAASTGLLRQYNYERMNLWYSLATIAVLLYAVSGYLADYVQSESVLWVAIASISVLSLLLVTGLVLQCTLPRFASRLYRRKNKDIHSLFTFAFTGGARASEALRNHYTINESAFRERLPGPSSEGRRNPPSSMGLK
ncbi:MAG: hypothetical protein J0651_04300 [Actinobacteria bacterium]|nr:hypothetical protein [Actinomycetota bacterium]